MHFAFGGTNESKMADDLEYMRNADEEKQFYAMRQKAEALAQQQAAQRGLLAGRQGLAEAPMVAPKTPVDAPVSFAMPQEKPAVSGFQMGEEALTPEEQDQYDKLRVWSKMIGQPEVLQEVPSRMGTIRKQP